MPSRPYRWPGKRRLLAGAAALAIATLALAGVSYAHTGTPSSIVVITSGLSVQASGTWSWSSVASASVPNYVGYAVDWGDVTSGNEVGTYNIGDGTAATNVVTLTTPSQGTSGSWGPMSHTYAAAGTYTVCVILYDLGKTTPFATTGYHSTMAGGVNRNTDNSVDKGYTNPVQCATFDVTAPTTAPTQPPTQAPTQAPTAFQSFSGATGTPEPPTATPFHSFEGATAVANASPTPPPTSTYVNASGGSGGIPELPLLLFAVLSFLGALALKPIRASRD
jgi:hypothetical protein